MGNSFSISNKFEKSIYYFENYAKLLLYNDDELENKIRELYKIIEYKDDFLEPIIIIRKNINQH